jgi:hypothetical protein
MMAQLSAMTTKKLDAWISKWLLFKPLRIVAPLLRSDYRLDGGTLVIKRPFRRAIPVKIAELDEIGVETTDKGPFIEDIFWILKQDKMRICIGDPHPIFQELMNQFQSMENFNWENFANAMSSHDNRYFLCWKRTFANP